MFPLFVSASELLKTDKTTYTEGEDILITATGSGADWVGIYKKGEELDPDNGGAYSIRWYYVAKEGNTSGATKNIFDSEYVNRAELSGLPAGEYSIYLLADGGYRILYQIDITIKSGGGTAVDPVPSGKTVTTDKSVYTEGEPILTTATGEGYDWVGLYLRTDKLVDDQAIRWYYVARDGNKPGDTKDMRKAEKTNSSRSAYFDVPAGEYTVYLCENDKYNVLAKVDITVNEDPTEQIVPVAPSKVTYARADAFPGAADGKLTITAGEGTLPQTYKAYWGDKNGPLADYTAFAPIPCTGEVTEYEMAANTLIPKAADRIIVYAVRKNKISEKPAEVMLPEGCNNYDFGTPLYEMQVMSDIHLNTSANHIHNQHFTAALADIKKLSPNSIGIFINGDIADHGEVAEYRAFQQLVKNAGDGIPKVYCAIGNHDLASGPYDQKLANFLKYTEPGTDTVYYDLWLNDIHFIFLGSEAPGLNAQLSRKQLNWFKEKLDERRDENRPTYVFLHQGLIDTVAGTFAYQKWHGIEQATQFAKILKDYPEVILFTGHSHWEMDSFQTMKARDEKLPTIFNTASCGYLWNDASMATDAGVEGAQGYYLYAYEDKVLMLGRDYVNGQWISSAQFLVQYDKKADAPGTTGTTNPGTEPPAQTSATGTSGQTPPQTTPGTTATQSPPVTSGSGNGSSSETSSKAPVGLIAGIAGAIAVAAAAAAVVITKKRKSGH